MANILINHAYKMKPLWKTPKQKGLESFKAIGDHIKVLGGVTEAREGSGHTQQQRWTWHHAEWSKSDREVSEWSKLDREEGHLLHAESKKKWYKWAYKTERDSQT